MNSGDAITRRPRVISNSSTCTYPCWRQNESESILIAPRRPAIDCHLRLMHDSCMAHSCTIHDSFMKHPCSLHDSCMEHSCILHDSCMEHPCILRDSCMEHPCILHDSCMKRACSIDNNSCRFDYYGVLVENAFFFD